eukprot:Sspe_Gene.13305::Locus_4554_Transcript_1_1_Confidence_1.000_Length_2635::g.13305::m.13305
MADPDRTPSVYEDSEESDGPTRKRAKMEGAEMDEDDDEEEDEEGEESEEGDVEMPEAQAASRTVTIGGWGSATVTKVVTPANTQQDVSVGVATGKDGTSMTDMIQQAKVVELENAAQRDPYDVSKHLALIAELQNVFKASKADSVWLQLRKAREHMKAHLALSPVQWATWGLQERQKDPDSIVTKKYVLQLLREALRDFLSVPLYVEYCELLNEIMEEEEDEGDETSDLKRIEAVRNSFEQAAQEVGADFSQGHLLWNAYRSFWQMEEEDPKRLASTLSKLYKRQLAIPHAGLDEAKQSMDEWLKTAELDDSDRKLLSSAERSYNLAKGLVKERLPYEDAVEGDGEKKKTRGKMSEEEKHWMAYIDFEKSRGDVVRVRSLLERAVASVPWSEALWERFLKEAGPETVPTVCTRALRCLPKSPRMLIATIHAVERGASSLSPLETAAMHRVTPTFFTHPHDLAEVVLEYLSSARRIAASNKAETPKVREQCLKWAAALAEKGQLKAANTVYEILAVVDGGHGAAVQSAFEKAVQLIGSKSSLPWLTYANHLSRVGAGADVVRSVYERAMEEVPFTSRSEIASDWLNYELLFGTASSLGKLKATYSSVFAFLHRRAAKEEQVTTKEEEEEKKDEAEKDTDDKEGASKEARRRERLKEKKGQIWKEKKEELGLEGAGKEDLTVFVWSLPFKAREEDIEHFFEGLPIEGIRLIKKKGGLSKGYAYVELKDAEAVAAALQRDKKRMQDGDKKRQVRVSRCDPQRRAKTDAKERGAEATPFEDDQASAAPVPRSGGRGGSLQLGLRGRGRGKGRMMAERPPSDVKPEDRGNDYFKNLLKK